MSPISYVIRRLLETDWKDMRPKDINDGCCDTFAENVVALVPEARILSDEILLKGATSCHSFVEYQGKFYDAECPDGTNDWGSLPCYVRERRLQYLIWDRDTAPVIGR